MKKLCLTFATALVLVPALSFAAKPAKSSIFLWCKSGGQVCPFGFETTKSGKAIKEIRAYNKCAQVPANFPKIRVKDDGRFKKSGSVTDVTGTRLTYTIQGRFKRPKKAVGTYDIDSRKCSAKPTKFVAKKVKPSPNEA